MSRAIFSKGLRGSALRWISALVLALCIGSAGSAQGTTGNDPHGGAGSTAALDDSDGISGVRTTPWDPEFIDLMRTLPVQQGGRVMPLDTLVRFALYRIHHKRVVRMPEEAIYGLNAGAALHPTQWALDTMVYPEWADSFPVFTLEDSEVLVAIGLADATKRRRDRYSYDEFSKAIPELADKYEEYRFIDGKRRTALQEQVVLFANAVIDYQRIRSALDFAEFRLSVADDPRLRELFGKDVVRCSDLLINLEELGTLLHGDLTPTQQVLGFSLRSLVGNAGMHWFAPTELEEERWLSIVEVFDRAGIGKLDPKHLDQVQKWEALADAFGDPKAEVEAARALHAALREAADARDQYAGVEGEVSYYKADWFGRGLYLFVAGFVLAAASWFVPRHTWFTRGALALTWGGNLMVICGIVMRCLLRGRPPVLNLYDTILFICGVGVTVLLIVEAVNRRRVALAAASILGAVLMLLAFGHELVDKRDTMGELQAVLRTNFWLATHVTTVTMGYAAGLLAWLLGVIFLLGRLFGIKREKRGIYQQIGKMIYGAIAFGVVFGTVGTILGGVWANDSWGRFWGWDPKENGALMIVIWFLVMLHARMAGYVRNHGMALMSIFGGVVVAFSWWGVNQLGVGLHSYGFTEGISTSLRIFNWISVGLFAAGWVALILDRARDRMGSPPAAA